MAGLRIAILAVIGLVVSLADDWPAITLISTALLVLSALLFIWSRFTLRGLSFSREMPTRATVGDDVTERLTLRNRSVIGKLFIEIEDRSTLAGHLANRVVSMGPRTVRQWVVTSTVKQRGAHVLGPVTLRSADPLGFFRREVRMPVLLDLIVYPLVVDLPDYTPASLLQSGGGVVHRRSQVPTAAVGGVREYSSGDSINVISWTATARAGRLMTKEFEVDPTSDAWIVLDVTSDLMLRDESRLSSSDPIDWLANDLEYRIMLAASLTRRLLELGRSVGLLANSEHTLLIPPERSDRQYIRIQELLAVIGGGSTNRLAEQITSASVRFQPNTAILCITSNHDRELAGALASMRRRRISSEVFFVDSSVMEVPPPEGLAESLLASEIPVRELSRYDHPSVVLRGGGMGQLYARRTA